MTGLPDGSAAGQVDGRSRRTDELLQRRAAFVALLQGVAVAANEALSIEEALQGALDRVCEITGWPVGHAYEAAEDGTGQLTPCRLWHVADPQRYSAFRSITEQTPLARGVGLPGQVLATGRPQWMRDVTRHPNFPRAGAAADIGVRGGFAFPVTVRGEVQAVLEFFSSQPEEMDEPLLEVMGHVGAQLGRVIERCRAEQALRAKERQTRQIIETASDAFVATDTDGRIIDWNHQSERMFGWTRSEALGRPVADTIIPERLRQAHEQGFRRFLDTGEPRAMGRRLELQTRRRDGSELPVELAVWAVGDGAGRTFNAFLRDISDRRRAEQAAAAESQRLAAIVAIQTELAAAWLDWDRVTALVVHRAVQLTDADGSVVEAIDADGVVHRGVHSTAALHLGPRFRGDEGLAGLGVAPGGVPLVCADSHDDPRVVSEFWEGLGVRSLAVVPLLHRGETVGLLTVVSARPGAFSKREVHSLELIAGLVGAAIGTAREFTAKQELLTQRTAVMDALEESEERFRQAFDNAPIGMAMIDLANATPGRVLQVNRAMCAITGYRQDQLLADDLVRVIHPADRQGNVEVLRRFRSGVARTHEAEQRYLHARGQAVWVHTSASVVRDTQGHPLYAIVQVQDVTARKEAEARLRELALFDPLTGLPNRTLLTDRLSLAMGRARRQQTLVGALFIDLDRFKEVNDGLGHHVGDRLLGLVAERLTGVLRPNDTAARLGGDEFVVLCEDLVAPDDAVTVAVRIAAALDRPFVLDGRELVVTASVGVATSGGHDSPDELLRRADAAMYRAKERGRAHHEVFSDLLERQAMARIETSRALRSALDSGGLRLHYQPTVDLRSNAIVGVEGLLRWQHQHGILGPAAFLEVAEETGLIVPIGAWVLTQACRQAAVWQRQRPDGSPLTVWVNLSARQAAATDLTELVTKALADSGLEPHLLGLELTETAPFSAGSSTLQEFRQHKELGVRLAIDDFGIGYASMTYLKEFPVDYLKIDRSFVQGVTVSARDAAIVEALIRLGASLGLGVVARVVETAEQLDWLGSLGCDMAQGYYLYRPGPPGEIQPVLAR
ncbi:MAG: EAL domain-containing protein [Actinomycetota bacterium]|nr:EAL domain-containing protein [Actinomycetota bacterium]